MYLEKARSALTRLFIDFYLKTSELLDFAELAKDIGGKCNEDVVDAMIFFDVAIAEQKIAILFIREHKTEGFDKFEHAKKNKHEVLTI